jgi:ribosomal protein L17
MAEEKSLEEILSKARELRRIAEELIKASETLAEKYEQQRRQLDNKDGAT